MTRSYPVSKLKPKEQFIDPERGPVVTPRFLLAVLLMLAGIAWIAYYYLGVRAPEGFDQRQRGVEQAARAAGAAASLIWRIGRCRRSVRGSRR